MARSKQAEEATEETTQETNGFVPEVIGDELPRVTRSHESGVWAKRLEATQAHPGQYLKVWPTGDKSPHPTVNLLKSGKAAGVNPSDYEFAGRTINGEGFVIAKFLTDEQKAERAAQEQEASEQATS